MKPLADRSEYENYPHSTPELGSGKTVSTYAKWHDEPPPSPHLIKRLQAIHWERSVPFLLAFLFVCGYVTILLTFGWLFFPLLYIGIGFLGVGGAILRKAWTRRADPQVSHLMDFPQVIAQFPVQVSLEKYGVMYGRDSGVISFVGSSLIYQGCRTNFNLERSTCQSSKVKYARRRNPKMRAWFTKFILRYTDSYYSFDYSDTYYSYNLRLVPFDSIDGFGVGFRNKFDEAYTEWLKESNVHVASVVLPPNTTYPPIARRWRRAELVSKGVAGLLVLTSIVGFIAELNAPTLWLGRSFGYGVLLLAAAVLGVVRARKKRLSIGFVESDAYIQELAKQQRDLNESDGI